MSNNIFATLGRNDLPDDFRLIAEMIGIEAARILMNTLAGIRFYLPSYKRLRPAIARYIRDRYTISSAGRSKASEPAKGLGGKVILCGGLLDHRGHLSVVEGLFTRFHNLVRSHDFDSHLPD